MLTYIIIATILVSLISFIGILISSKIISKSIHYMISFAAASLIAVSLFDLIPHAIHENSLDAEIALTFVGIGIIIFFLVERVIHWHHCGKECCNKKPVGSLVLAGDFVHNFLDGVVIAGAFLLDVKVGIAVSLSVIIHEIPQEFGDFVVLLHSGIKRKKALLLNFYSALSAVLGGILGYFLFESVNSIIPYAVLIAAGGFLYIALSDIVPTMHEHFKEKRMGITETIIFVLTLIGFKLFLEAMHAH